MIYIDAETFIPVAVINPSRPEDERRKALAEDLRTYKPRRILRIA